MLLIPPQIYPRNRTQDPFWLPDIVVGIKKKKMWGDGSNDETGTFCPDLLSLVLTCVHQMDIMGLDGIVGVYRVWSGLCDLRTDHTLPRY